MREVGRLRWGCAGCALSCKHMLCEASMCSRGDARSSGPGRPEIQVGAAKVECRTEAAAASVQHAALQQAGNQRSQGVAGAQVGAAERRVGERRRGRLPCCRLPCDPACTQGKRRGMFMRCGSTPAHSSSQASPTHFSCSSLTLDGGALVGVPVCRCHRVAHGFVRDGAAQLLQQVVVQHGGSGSSGGCRWCCWWWRGQGRSRRRGRSSRRSRAASLAGCSTARDTCCYGTDQPQLLHQLLDLCISVAAADARCWGNSSSVRLRPGQ